MKIAWHSAVLLAALLLPIAVTEAQSTRACSNGLDGYESADVCCPLSCGSCGGDGCQERGEGCCADDVIRSGVLCSEANEAPCFMDDIGETSTTPAPEGSATPAPEGSATPAPEGSATPAPEGSATPAPQDSGLQTCSNGIEGIDANGVVCCPTSCGACAGTDCASRPGGAAACCGSGIKSSEIMCSESQTAPCIIDGEVNTTPSPATPTPVMPTPVAAASTSPTPVMEIPTSCEPGKVPSFRYASTSGKVGRGRLYAESEGCFTMTDVYNWRGFETSAGALYPKGPIYALDENDDVITEGDAVTGKWLLTAELYVTNGAIFYCKGSGAGGDCDELRIQSTGDDDWYEVRGHGGSLYFESTVVTSWDTPNKEPQETYEGGRSFLNCISEKLTGDDCEGNAKNEMGECRMDLINTEAGYLGFLDSESYGLTWKVRGFCKDLSNPDVFETTNVYGNIIGSDIHHNYYGHYSYGHQGGVWTNNKMHDNIQYGFDPHDDSDYLTIADNEVYGNGNHGIIASKRCNDVHIFNNVVYDGGPEAAGIFLHRSSDYAKVHDNTIYNMQDAGIAMLEAMNAEIYDNSIDGVRYGIRMSLGSAGNNVWSNTFNDCWDYGLYTYQGSDAPTEGVSDGRPSDNVFSENIISDTPGGVKFKYSDNLVVIDNEFTGTAELEFFDAQGTEWSGNTLPDSGVCVDNVTSDDGSSIAESTFVDSEGLPGDC